MLLLIDKHNSYSKKHLNFIHKHAPNLLLLQNRFETDVVAVGWGQPRLRANKFANNYLTTKQTSP